MRVLIATALVLSMVGCTAPSGPPMNHSGNAVSSATHRASLQRARADRDARKAQLRESKLQEEIDRLTVEIRELELRIISLEGQVADAERREREAVVYSRPASSGCYTGPRGGRYTISKSGKKNYGGC
ncbi:MAG: hypothetical protein CVU36_00435 [Betaproteobacteria bacterium HGW-Betaproteobacteria-9]|jgi:TolA-binding protein|nr:MAG: hypothetical protein CVU36_00435 [Betaproteobacteria bacterium HGW-Betaproteobacteria-9]